MLDSRQRLFEIMGRLDPTFKPKTILKESKKNMNESHPFGWDYPAGTEHNPNAPWNEPPDPEWVDTVFEPDNNIEDFTVRLISNNPSAHYDIDLYRLVQKYAPNDEQYFIDTIQQPNVTKNPEFVKKIDAMLTQLDDDGLVEWEGDEQEYDEPPERKEW